MSDHRTLDNSEINLYELLEALWNGKLKIISSIVITIILGLVYIIATPNPFYVSTPIQQVSSNVFPNYEESIFVDEEYYLSSSKLSELGAPSNLLTMFIREFEDYEEMVNVLNKNEFVIQSIQHLDNDLKKIQLYEYAKLFRIDYSDTNNQRLTFEWHDQDEGKNLFTKAIIEALKNVKLTLINDVELIASSNDLAIKRKLEILNKKLDALDIKSKLLFEKKKRYLIEQSAIAKELNIERDITDTSIIRQRKNVVLSVNTESGGYYLRGYKAIDKELSLMEERNSKEKLLTTPKYIDLIDEVELIKNDLSSQQLRSYGVFLEKINSDDWINFNWALADSKLKINKIIIVLYSLFLGLILGVLYVLVSNSHKKYKKQANTI